MHKTEWITPLEASMAMSLKYGYYISPDDIKQLRTKKRIDEKHIKKMSMRLSLYDRAYLLTEVKAPQKRTSSKTEITDEIVATWLESCQMEKERLEKENITLSPEQQAAAQTLIEQREIYRREKRAGRNSQKVEQDQPAQTS